MVRQKAHAFVKAVQVFLYMLLTKNMRTLYDLHETESKSKFNRRFAIGEQVAQISPILFTKKNQSFFVRTTGDN